MIKVRFEIKVRQKVCLFSFSSRYRRSGSSTGKGKSWSFVVFKSNNGWMIMWMYGRLRKIPFPLSKCRNIENSYLIQHFLFKGICKDYLLFSIIWPVFQEVDFNQVYFCAFEQKSQKLNFSFSIPLISLLWRDLICSVSNLWHMKYFPINHGM